MGKETDKFDDSHKKIFSIIIPTYNEEKYIGALLERIFGFDLDGFVIEVIVVDNGSNDTTLSIVKKYPCSIYVLPRATIAEMRNYGANMAHGEWIGFIDADCMPIKNWAVLAKNQLTSDSTIGVVGSYYSMTCNPTWVEKLWFSMKHATQGKVNFLPAGNMALRRQEFIDIKGFPSDIVTGEDYALCQRYIMNGFAVINNSSLKMIHFGNVKKLSDIVKKEVWYGLSFQQSLKKNLMSKVFLASCLYLAGCLLIAVSIILYIFSNFIFSNYLFIVGLLFIFMVVIPYSLIATIRSRKVHYVFGYIMIFFSYFFGRTTAMINIICRRLFIKEV